MGREGLREPVQLGGDSGNELHELVQAFLHLLHLLQEDLARGEKSVHLQTPDGEKNP